MECNSEINTIAGCRYRWLLPHISDDQSCQLAATYNLCVPLAQVLVNRGFDNRQKIDSFLFTAHEHEVGDPRMLKDALKSVERIQHALATHEKILVVGDYDVDGITATSLVMVCLLQQGARVNYFLPNRMKDGYGISERVIERAAASGYSLIITVDNGITAFEAVSKAKDRGIDVLVFDHHVPHNEVPLAYAVVDPLQKDCSYPFKHLAGVGVAFKVMSLLYQLLDKPLPPKIYELLLLGTIADVVPLTGENRYWVRKGLLLVNENPSYALTCLKNYAKITKKNVSALDIAFFLTPQLNALGRLQDPREGVLFLIGHDTKEIDRIGRTLFELNQARKDIERLISAEVMTAIKNGDIDLTCERVIIAASNAWPMGVIGLVASRLVSEFARPTLLFHIGDDGIARGSARSIPSFNIFDALTHGASLINHFGGHAAAAGLSLPVAHISALKELLENRMRELVSAEDLVAKITIDASISLSDATGKFVDDLAYFEPFGCMNTNPVFHVPSVTLLEEPQLLKDTHVKCRVFSQGVIKPVIFFNRPELYTLLREVGDKPFDLAVEVVENYWQEMRSIELKGADIALKGT